MCFKAKGNIVIHPTPEESQVYKKGKGGDIHQVTRAFIIDALLKFLAPYSGKSVEEVLEAAAKDKFRYVGRTITRDLKNEVERRCLALKNKVDIVHVDRAADDDATHGDDSPAPSLEGCWAAPIAMLDGGTVAAQQEDNRKYLAFLKKHETALVDAIGREAVEDVKVTTSLYPKIYERNPRRIQADITAALQRWHDISERAARERKTRTLARVNASDSKVLEALRDLIAYGNDENTLVEHFISPNGKGRRVVKIRVRL
ncbi:MAG: hypothetical protein WBC04_17510 [Candidatus Acidiferrales bacterium]